MPTTDEAVQAAARKFLLWEPEVSRLETDTGQPYWLVSYPNAGPGITLVEDAGHLHPDRPVVAGSRGKLVVQGPSVIREQRQDAHDLFVALVMTGGRWNEVASLTWGQIAWDAGTIRLFGFKAEKERTVPLVGQAAEMLRRRAGSKRGQLVFPGPGGRKRTAPSRALQRAIDAAGCNSPEMVAQFGRATVHSLRHTYGSWLRQAGLDLADIQELLGHADLQMTRRYSKVPAPQRMSRAGEALERVANRRTP